MSNHLIVTIGRQFGSGGCTIGKIVAERMGLAFYDRELLESAAKKSGLDPALFEHNDEVPINSLLYALSTSPLVAGHLMGGSIPIAQQVYLAQFDAMRKLAAEKDCLFMGRCADYILRKEPRLLNVYIHAPLESRIKRVAERSGVSETEAKEQILKIDKRRTVFYNTYSDHPWGQMTSYHLTVDSSVLSVEDTAELIVQMAQKGRADVCSAT